MLESRIPPQNIEVEKTILGSIILESRIFDLVNGLVRADMFYLSQHQIIYSRIVDLNQSGTDIDMITLTNLLRAKNELDTVGGAYYISLLTSNIGSASHIESHCQILVQDWIRREMIQITTQSIDKLYDLDTDIVDIYNDITTQLDTCFDIKNNEVEKIGQIMSRRVDEIEKRKPGQIIGIDTGLSDFNTMIGGWQPGDLIILAARPSMGKTAISLLFAKYPSLFQDKGVLYFSLEMPAERLADRIISLETTINSELLQTNKLNQSEWSSIYDVIDRYSNANLYINDKSGLTIEEIKSISIIESRKRKIDLVLIDYLQLIRFSMKNDKSTNDQITFISKNIKALAKKINCPIIALSQLNRDVEKRSDRRPLLSDLRDSGALEQDADLVLFLYRDDYYYPESENKNVIEMIAAKNRNGRIGTTNIYRNDNWSYLSDKPFNEFYSEQIPIF